jgi:6-phosphogluconolactonase (cycloisomerase 2 family)
MTLKLGFGLLVAMAVTVSSLAAHAAPGAVYTLSNSSSGNAVLVFSRAANGQLSPAGMFPTGGLGSGKGLGNQGALTIDAGNRFLFAVNPASNSVSVFRIKENSLQWIEADPSGGVFPISLTVNRGVLYVLNNGGAAGSTDTIAGFSVSHDGHLTPIVSGLALSAATVGPAQIGFDTDSDVLLVTEKSTNNLDVFSVDANGVAGGPTVIPSAGETPFGFAFGKRNQVLVSDAFGGAANAGAVSSYLVAGNSLETITGVASDQQSAPCWVVITNDGRFAYTTNTGSGSVSGYKIGFNGGLQLLNASGVTASTGTGSTPLDAAFSNDGRFLYVLTPGTNNIQGFSLGSDGSLTPLTQVAGSPPSASGLAAR